MSLYHTYMQATQRQHIARSIYIIMPSMRTELTITERAEQLQQDSELLTQLYHAYPFIVDHRILVPLQTITRLHPLCSHPK